jgi:hypothetical protein
MSRASIRAVVGVAAVGVVPATAAWLVPGDSRLAAHAAIGVAAIAKLSLLAAAAWWSLCVRDRLDLENPARRAWGRLALGFLGLLAGHLTFVPEQVVHGTTPFPSAADLFFIPAQALLVVAFLGFLRAYRSSGLFDDAMDTRVFVRYALVAAAVGAAVLWTVARGEAGPLERVLDAAYPLLDLAMLVPLAMLVRLAHRMRGSGVWRVWVTILSGFACFAAGDVLFAWAGALGGLQGLGSLVTVPYLLAYALAAAGAKVQLDLLAPADAAEAASRCAEAAPRA